MRVSFPVMFSICKGMGPQTLRFAAVSLVSLVIDLGLFSLLFSGLFSQVTWGVFAAAAAARVLSGTCNFLLNRGWVFRAGNDLRAGSGMRRQAAGYLALFCTQLLLSALLTTRIATLPVPLPAGKLLVDGALFLISYQVQRRLIFRHSPPLQQRREP